MRKINIILFVAALLFAINCDAKVSLPSLISNGMVLQCEAPLKIWGYASPQEGISIIFKNKSYTAAADENGRWQVTLPPQKAGGPYTIKINDITLVDILIGDVWLCSGQSNMELPIRRVIRAFRSELSTATNPNIRQFKVPLKYSFHGPESDVKGEWKSVDPNSVLDFSAVAYFFASELYKKYNVPVGILNASVGGSPTEAWIDESSLKPFPRHLEELAKCKDDSYINQVKNQDLQNQNRWQLLTNANDMGLNDSVKWSAQEVNTQTWLKFEMPGNIPVPANGITNGSYWLRKDADIPVGMVDKPCEIELGCILDCDSVYINGKFVGTTGYQYPPRIYTIPAGILKEGKNSIAIRLMSYNGNGGFVSDKPYEIRTTDATLKVDLKGSWLIKKGASSEPRKSSTFFQYKPSGLYNSMIAPLTGYAIKGVVWYQGESNISNPAEYEQLMRKLIPLWRTEFANPSLPFLLIQLPNFNPEPKAPGESGWAALREAQSNLLDIANTALIATYDIGEWNDIHPLNKKDVGIRLVKAAGSLVYNDKKAAKGAPRCINATVKEGKIYLTFTNIDKGWSKAAPLNGFVIADDKNHLYWANASFEGNTVVVSLDSVPHPTEVRYAWSDNPVKANLKSSDGILAIPFKLRLSSATE